MCTVLLKCYNKICDKKMFQHGLTNAEYTVENS